MRNSWRNQPISLRISKQPPTPDYKREGDVQQQFLHADFRNRIQLHLNEPIVAVPAHFNRRVKSVEYKHYVHVVLTAKERRLLLPDSHSVSPCFGPRTNAAETLEFFPLKTQIPFHGLASGALPQLLGISIRDGLIYKLAFSL